MPADGSDSVAFRTVLRDVGLRWTASHENLLRDRRRQVRHLKLDGLRLSPIDFTRLVHLSDRFRRVEPMIRESIESS